MDNVTLTPINNQWSDSHHIFPPADQNRIRQQTDAEKTKSSCTVRQVKQQLHRERQLKLEAFHQVEDLLTQVRASPAL